MSDKSTLTVGPDHSMFLKTGKLYADNFSQVCVISETGHVVAQFFGPSAKLNAAKYVYGKRVKS